LTSDLQKRYDVCKAVIYERLKTLHIKPYKQGNRSYVSGDQLKLMDDLDAHLKGGGETNDFVQEQIADLTIVVPKTDELEAESSALMTQEQAQAMVAAPLNDQPVPPGAVAPHINDEELESIDRQAQFIAAGRYIATQELADYYANTGSFTIPEVLQRVKERRSQTSNHWEQAHRSADPNALSQLLLQKAKQKAAGVVAQPEND